VTLSRAALLARLADPSLLARAAPTASDDAEAGVAARGGLVEAAVLVPIIWRPEPSILLTLRAARLSSHAGQVAFPGGRLEPGETARAAALRETAEEVGIHAGLPTIAAELPPHLTGTGYRVTPVVASLDPPFDLSADPGEVAEIFEFPLATVLDPAAPERRQQMFRGRVREFWVWPHDRHLIWGATAAILVNLQRILRP